MNVLRIEVRERIQRIDGIPQIRRRSASGNAQKDDKDVVFAKYGPKTAIADDPGKRRPCE